MRRLAALAEEVAGHWPHLLAFGSKLVALNAKVEAAHLGEQGAAFGVVADEISSHARQSGEITDRLMGEMQQLRATVAETSSESEEMARMSVGTLEASRSELEHALVELTRIHTEMESTLESSVRQGHELAQRNLALHNGPPVSRPGGAVVRTCCRRVG